MAELADALDSGSSGVTPVKVQVLSLAPTGTAIREYGSPFVVFLPLSCRVSCARSALEDERFAGPLSVCATLAKVLFAVSFTDVGGRYARKG